jgi:hypothetical protein
VAENSTLGILFVIIPIIIFLNAFVYVIFLIKLNKVFRRVVSVISTFPYKESGNDSFANRELRYQRLFIISESLFSFLYFIIYAPLQHKMITQICM